MPEERDPFWIPDEKPKSNGSFHKDQQFVDLKVFEDYVLLCGQRINRKEAAKDGGTVLDKKTWVDQWLFMKKKLAARGSMKDLNSRSSAQDQMDMFRKMVARSWDS